MYRRNLILGLFKELIAHTRTTLVGATKTDVGPTD